MKNTPGNTEKGIELERKPPYESAEARGQLSRHESESRLQIELGFRV